MRCLVLEGGAEFAALQRRQDFWRYATGEEHAALGHEDQREIAGHPAVNCVKDPALGHREATIILSCRSGARSALAADALRKLGFRDPVSLAGGFNGWAAAGRPVVK